MLQAATDRADAYPADMDASDRARPASVGPVAALPSISVSGDRYGGQRKLNLPAVIAILAIHVLLIGALIQVRNHVVRMQEAKLTVVNLSPPPPPPAAETPPPPPSKPAIVAPPPIVQTPAPPVLVATTPDPTPVIAPAPTAPTPPAPPAPPVAMATPSVVQAGDLGAQMVSGKPPRYPIDSRRKREQGTVLLTLIVGTDGGVESIGVARSSGFSRLDDAARDAVKHWRWRPIIRDGQAVRVKGVVEIPFIIRT